MATSLEILRTGVRYVLVEAAAATWTDVEINWAINKAKDKVAHEMTLISRSIFRKTSYATLVSAQNEYDLPSDNVAIIRVAFVGVTPAVPGDRIPDWDRWQHESATTSAPMRGGFGWFLDGQSVYIIPAPDAAGTNHLAYWHQYLPADLSSSEDLDANMEIAKGWLELEAAKKCLLHRGDNVMDLIREIRDEKDWVLNTISTRQKAAPQYIDRTRDEVGVSGRWGILPTE